MNKFEKEIIYKASTALCACLLFAATIFVILNWHQVPDEIPIHYNFSGEVDRYGGKGALIFMMILAWVLLVVFSVISKCPNCWNMPVKVTDENKDKLYSITKMMLEIVKPIACLLFAIMMINAASVVSLPQWIIMALALAIVLVIVVSICLMYKNR